MNLFSCMKSTLYSQPPFSTFGQLFHDTARFMTQLFIQRKCLSAEVLLWEPLDIISPWQNILDMELLRCIWLDVFVEKA